MFLVTGGLDWPLFLSSTEILMEGDSQWQVLSAAQLPLKIDGIRGVSINNNIYVTGMNFNENIKYINYILYDAGGSNGIESHDLVYKFDKENQSWELHSEKLQTKRAYHAIGISSEFERIEKLNQCSSHKYKHCQKTSSMTSTAEPVSTTSHSQEILKGIKGIQFLLRIQFY